MLAECPVGVLAVAVVEHERCAREKGWLEADEDFAFRTVVESLHWRVTAVDPGAEFAVELVDDAATAGTITDRLRRRAEQVAVSDVLVGRENAGRIITPMASVGGGVAPVRHDDVHIVRRPLPREAR